MIRCCFAGHRMASRDLLPEILSAMEEIVREADAIEFFSGGMGDFDKLCEQAAREIKKRFPEKEIKLCRILPNYSYAPKGEDRIYVERSFDEILVCEASDGAHYKAMIGIRNRWMVERSDFMIAYVNYSSGGAYTSLKYAQKLKKKILRVGMQPENEGGVNRCGRKKSPAF